jgi:hypothetical protein
VLTIAVRYDNPQHKQHLKAFLTQYLTVNKNAEFAIIKINPDDWAIDLENPKKNTVQCCQMCSIQEDIKRVTSPGWTDQPASYNPYELKIGY